jgi:hypothetical protein
MPAPDRPKLDVPNESDAISAICRVQQLRCYDDDAIVRQRNQAVFGSRLSALGARILSSAVTSL